MSRSIRTKRLSFGPGDAGLRQRPPAGDGDERRIHDQVIRRAHDAALEHPAGADLPRDGGGRVLRRDPASSPPPASRTAASTERVSAARGPPSPVSLACIRSTIPCRRYCTLGSAPAVRNGSTATRFGVERAGAGAGPGLPHERVPRRRRSARRRRRRMVQRTLARRASPRAPRTGCVCVGVIPPLGAASGSSAATSSSAVWNRSAGPLGEAAHHHRLERGREARRAAGPPAPARGSRAPRASAAG